MSKTIIMKNIYDSAETFEAYATIDAAHYMLRQLQEKHSAPVSPLIRAIDKATGFDAVAIAEYYVEGILIVEDMIAAKKVIEADYTADTELLNQFKKALSGI